jgi:HK97 family phage major capsid protein
MGEFGYAVREACRPSGKQDERLAPLRAAPGIQAAPSNFHETSGTDEGYMVPPDFSAAVFALMFEQPSLASMVDREPTNSNMVEKPADESTPWGATGVQAAWRSEGVQMVETKLSTEDRIVRLNELYAFVTATDELLQDAPRLNNRLTVNAAAALLWKMNEGIVNGTGVGQPLGYMAAGSLVSVAKESGQAADTIVAANILKMYSRMLQTGIGRTIWLANSDILSQLGTISIGNQPVFVPQNQGLVSAPSGTLMGRPLLFTEHNETLGDKGDIHFIDPMGYYSPTKAGGVQFATSMHLFFDYGMSAFRWMLRFGGQPHLQAAVSPAKGSSTKSHFVTLDARA